MYVPRLGMYVSRLGMYIPRPETEIDQLNFYSLDRVFTYFTGSPSPLRTSAKACGLMVTGPRMNSGIL